MTQTLNKPVAAEADTRLAAFDRLEGSLAKQQPAWLFPLRKAGISQFAELGYPTLHDEDWRFTNVAHASKLPFLPATEPASASVTLADLKQFPFADQPGTRLVFVDGHYAAALSNITALPEGVKVTNLKQALTTDAALIEKHLTRYSGNEANAFAALNIAFFTDGLFVHVPKNAVVEQAVQVIYLSTATATGAAAHVRNLVIVDANAKVTLLESYVSLAKAPYVTNAITELVVGDNAWMEHVKFQDEAADAFHFAALHGVFGRTSKAWTHSIALGGKLARYNLRTKLDGEGLEAILNGLYLTRNEQVIDHHMIVEHAKAHCASHEYFNGILDDKSKGVFHGRILVKPDAQKTDAKQTNRNLLLSDDATADAKPQLEIYADDVKCTHGATIGRMNEEQIFYLRARGIGEKTARRMLMHAFAGEIIDRVQTEAVREELDKIVWERLETNPHLHES